MLTARLDGRVARPHTGLCHALSNQFKLHDYWNSYFSTYFSTRINSPVEALTATRSLAVSRSMP
jgi:hypothetical protein